jgi:hypothetical protein
MPSSLALLALFYGIALLFFPVQFIQKYGTTLDPSSAVIARLYGSAMCTFAILYWINRNIPGIRKIVVRAAMVRRIFQCCEWHCRIDGKDGWYRQFPQLEYHRFECDINPMHAVFYFQEKVSSEKSKLRTIQDNYYEASYRRRLPFACNFFLNFRPITINFLAGLKVSHNGCKQFGLIRKRKIYNFKNQLIMC